MYKEIVRYVQRNKQGENKNMAIGHQLELNTRVEVQKIKQVSYFQYLRIEIENSVREVDISRRIDKELRTFWQ